MFVYRESILMGFFGTPCSMFFPTFNIKNYNTDYEKIIILSESDCCIFEKEETHGQHQNWCLIKFHKQSFWERVRFKATTYLLHLKLFPFAKACLLQQNLWCFQEVENTYCQIIIPPHPFVLSKSYFRICQKHNEMLMLQLSIYF